MAARSSAGGLPLVSGPSHFHRSATGANIAPMPFGGLKALSRAAHFAFEDLGGCPFTCRWHHIYLISARTAPLTLDSMETQLEVSVEDVAFLSIFNSRCRSYDC